MMDTYVFWSQKHFRFDMYCKKSALGTIVQFTFWYVLLLVDNIKHQHFYTSAS